MIEGLYDPVDGLVKMGLALLLVIMVIILSYTRGIHIEREVGIATARAVIQLMAVVLIIAAVFQSGNPLLTILILIVMVVIAAHTSSKRASRIKNPLKVTLVSIGAGSAVSLAMLIGLGVIPLNAEFLIPIGSMTIGGSMIICSLAIDRFVGEIESHAPQIQTALCLGATDEEAMFPYTSESVRASLIPSIDRLKTLGIVVLPGAMAGMIIGGVNPIWAAEYQLVIMFLLLSSGMLTALIAIHLAQKRA